MNEIREEFLLETGKIEKFEVITVTETVEVKGQSFENDHVYWKLVENGELYLPFDDPDVNLDMDYAKYKELNHLLSTEEIVAIRQSYGLTLRTFASILGVGYGSLSKIENGLIQSAAHDATLRLAKDPYSFYVNLAEPKKESIPEEEFAKLSARIEPLIMLTYKEHERIAKNVLDKTNAVVRRVNELHFDYVQATRREEQRRENNWTTETKLTLRKFISFGLPN